MRETFRRHGQFFYKVTDAKTKKPYRRKNCIVCGRSKMMQTRPTAIYCSLRCGKLGDLNPSKKKATAHGLSKSEYVRLHQQVRKIRGKASRCINGCTARVYHWANLTGRYEDVSDYQEMCPSCHDSFDRRKQGGE